jgi:hypothetical protein
MSLLKPTDEVGRQSCYECGKALGWNNIEKRLVCTSSVWHVQNRPHPDFLASVKETKYVVDEDALYLAQSVSHLLDHLKSDVTTFYCEDISTARHFAQKILKELGK